MSALQGPAYRSKKLEWQPPGLRTAAHFVLPSGAIVLVPVYSGFWCSAVSCFQKGAPCSLHQNPSVRSVRPTASCPVARLTLIAASCRVWFRKKYWNAVLVEVYGERGKVVSVPQDKASLCIFALWTMLALNSRSGCLASLSTGIKGA